MKKIIKKRSKKKTKPLKPPSHPVLSAAEMMAIAIYTTEDDKPPECRESFLMTQAYRVALDIELLLLLLDKKK
jgi:hypothetical protein